MTEQERFVNLLAADEAQRHAQNGEPRTVSALKAELLRDERRSDMSLQDGLELSGSADPTPAAATGCSRAGTVGTKRDNAAWEAVNAAANADEAPTPTRRQPPEGRPITETAREAGKLSGAVRAKRIQERDLPPSDEAIEIGLRKRAVESAKDAEVLFIGIVVSRPRTAGRAGTPREFRSPAFTHERGPSVLRGCFGIPVRTSRAARRRASSRL
jgi:hypothetical protein